MKRANYLLAEGGKLKRLNALIVQASTKTPKKPMTKRIVKYVRFPTVYSKPRKTRGIEPQPCSCAHVVKKCGRPVNPNSMRQQKIRRRLAALAMGLKRAPPIRRYGPRKQRSNKGKPRVRK